MTEQAPPPTEMQDEPWRPLFDAIVDRLQLSDPNRIAAWHLYVEQLPALAASQAAIDQTPAPSATRDRMKRVMAACDALLEALQDDTPQDGRLRPVPQLLWGLAAQLAPDDPNAAVIGGQADHALEDAFSGVLMLRAAAELVRDAEADRVASGVGGTRHKAAAGYHMTFDFLLDVYEAISERPLGTSWDDMSGAAGGPLVDFLQLCLQALGYTPTKNAPRTAVRRAIKARRTDPNKSAAPQS
ncbi:MULTISPECIES: hypothetical protein [unclassified Azospirillum]|uniref:hypothetical protein n=1 Tax=unclassified Azospirillum TaxID=2630922 RepID=UPI0011B1CD69|nr:MULTISPECIES: hypothetical protein [unclassified Azospirillum]